MKRTLVALFLSFSVPALAAPPTNVTKSVQAKAHEIAKIPGVFDARVKDGGKIVLRVDKSRYQQATHDRVMAIAGQTEVGRYAHNPTIYDGGLEMTKVPGVIHARFDEAANAYLVIFHGDKWTAEMNAGVQAHAQGERIIYRAADTPSERASEIGKLPGVAVAHYDPTNKTFVVLADKKLNPMLDVEDLEASVRRLGGDATIKFAVK